MKSVRVFNQTDDILIKLELVLCSGKRLLAVSNSKPMMRATPLCILLLLLTAGKATAQTPDSTFSRTSLTTAVGLGFQDGREETGFGLLLGLGVQRSYTPTARVRLSAGVLLGEFSGVGVRDVPDAFYTLTALEVGVAADVLRYRAVALVAGLGGFVGYTRGLFGTGGDPGARESRYFVNGYVGGKLGVGVRVNPAGRRVAFEVRPLNIYAGSGGFVIGSGQLGVELKLRK